MRFANRDNTDPDTLVVSIPEAARLANVGRSSIYKVINSGDLPAKKIGRRTVILRADVIAWLTGLDAPAMLTTA